MNFDFINMLYSLPAVIIGLTIHEYSHAYIAYKLGDDTAKQQGRMTLNPLQHIDPLGMLFIMLAGFGWAKPVQFTPSKLQSPKRDRILIALAGPVSNLIVGCLFLCFIKLFLIFSYSLPESIYEVVIKLLFYVSVVNLGLFIFNMLPVPPLDGSHVFLSGMNLSSVDEQKLARYGSIALLIIIIIENRTNIDLIPISTFTTWIVSLFF